MRAHVKNASVLFSVGEATEIALQDMGWISVEYPGYSAPVKRNQFLGLYPYTLHLKSLTCILYIRMILYIPVYKYKLLAICLEFMISELFFVWSFSKNAKNNLHIDCHYDSL